MDQTKSTLDEWLSSWEEETSQFQERILSLLRSKQNEHRPICYLESTTNLDDSSQQKHNIISNIFIKNQTSYPLTQPRLLIDITSPHRVEVSGKYKLENHVEVMSKTEWEKIEPPTFPQESMTNRLLFRSLQQQLAPSDILSFKQFQVTFFSGKRGYLLLKAYLYCDEYKEGIPALNSIVINY